MSQRIKIEEMLNQRCRKSEIAKELDKIHSTIAREINRHHIVKPHSAFINDNSYNCNILLIAKFAQANAEYFKQFHVTNEIEILALSIIVQNEMFKFIYEKKIGLFAIQFFLICTLILH